MRASILTIGNELLKGRTVNTNFSHIGRVLTYAGYDVYRGIIVRDDPAEISWGITQCVGFSDLVVTSGGLGPTFDDMTVECISDALGLSLETNPEALSMIRSKYLAQNLELTPERMKMAILPRGSEPLPNPVGTAPGVLLRYRGKVIVILPGVPSEMKAILDSIIPRLKVPGRSYHEESIIIEGVMESAFAPVVAEEMKLSGGSVYIKSHPVSFELNNPVLEIEVSASAEDEAKARELVERALKHLKDRYEEIRGKQSH